MTMPYVVQAGDSWFRIARRAGLAVDELADANASMHPNRDEYLIPGQVLFIPRVQCGTSGPVKERGSIVRTDYPYGYIELMDDLQLFLRTYPFVQAEWIGWSVTGRPIPAVRLGIGPREAHVNGAFHANEWITTPLLMKFAERYASACLSGEALSGYPIRELYARTSLWIVPMVNPDGVELVHCGIWPTHPWYERVLAWNGGSHRFAHWKANIRGVDLNDQFPAHWEEEKARRAVPGPGPRDYAGVAPLTEPEALAVARFTCSRRFRLVIAFHTQGEEIYWNYRGLEPPESERIAQRFGQVSGYRPVKLSGSDAGYKDWFIQDFRRPGFTVEAGCGVNPLPLEQFDAIYEQCEKILLEGLMEAAERS